MSRKKPENQYYSLENILEKKCTYNVIFGERSNGKTYSVLKHGIQNFLQTGKQLAIVRRWKEDIRGRRASEIFSALNDNREIEKLSQGKYKGVTYQNGKFYACTYDAKDNKPIYSEETDCIGHCFALSDTEHNKSISYPKVTTIMFDEFLTKHVYLEDEFVLFMNTVSTIVRQRTDVTIFMLGNTVNKYCPYFQEMGLRNVMSMKQGSIDIYTYGTSDLRVAVEYCNTLKKQKKNNYYFAFDNPKLNMITSGAWELDIYPHLPEKYKPKQIKFIFFIEFMGRVFQCEIVDVKGEMFIFIHEKTTPIKDRNKDLIYTLEYNYKLNYNRSVFKPINTVQKRIAFFFQTDRVFYQNNDVGDAVHNYLKICRTGGF